MEVRSYRDLQVWQKSMDLVVKVYKFVELLPPQELYALSSQIRRSAVSIPSNIAEGSRRGSRAEFRQFLLIAFGSGAELETQLEIAKKLSFGKVNDVDSCLLLLNEVMKMLNVFISKMTKK